MSDEIDTQGGGSRTDRLSRRTALQGLGVAAAGIGLGTVADWTAASHGSGRGDPSFLQFFHEDWATIENYVPDVADQGWDGIWIMAPQKSALTKEDQDGRNDPPLGYQPVDRSSFDSEWGTEAELQSLISTAHDNGVEVYVDTVLNHNAADVDCSNYPQLSCDNFHSDVGEIRSYKNEHQVEHGELLGLDDLAQLDNDRTISGADARQVRDVLYDYVAKIANAGADGYRYDAVKHIEEEFFDKYANPWADELGMDFRVGEVFSGDTAKIEEYTSTGMSAFDYPLKFNAIDSVFEYGDMRDLEGAGYVAQNPFRACPFVENHDEGPPSQRKLAYAHIFGMEGYPHAYDLYAQDILDDPDFDNFVYVRSNLAGGDTTWRHTSADLAVYERGAGSDAGDLLVGLNNSDGAKSATVTTSWPDTELEDYSGSAPNVTTDGNGDVTVDVPAEDWVYYAPAGAL